MRALNCGKFLTAGLFICIMIPFATADQVVLKNGDRVTGSIVKKDDRNLTIKTDHLGVVTVALDQIASIAADKPLHIVLRDGKELEGTLSQSAQRVELTTAQAKLSVAPEEIAFLRDDAEEKAYRRLLHPGWLELWTGTGTIGFAGTAGNAKTLSFTTGINANRATKTDKTSLYFNLIKASARIDNKSQDTAEAVRGGISYAHNAGSRIFFSVFNDYEYDRFQNLDLRFVVGGGAGIHAVKTAKSSLDLLAGVAYNRSSFSTPLVRESAELYWGNEYSLKLNSATTFVQSYRMFNDLTNTGPYRITFDMGLSTKLAKWLSWNLSISDRYLSDPAPGRLTNDFLYTTGLGITFAK